MALITHTKSGRDHTSLTGLLVVRTWAFWRKSKRVLIGLVTYSVVRVPQDWNIDL